MAYTIAVIVTLLILGASAYHDMGTMKIPNEVTFLGIFSGLVYSLIFFHTGTFFSRILAIVALFFFGMLNLMGMGDLKLCMAVTAWVGWRQMLFMVLGGCLFMLLYCILENKDRTLKEVKTTFLKFIYRIPVNGWNGKQYPFSIFLLLGFIAIRPLF